MSLVPSGRVRIMEAQSLNWNPSTPDVNTTEAADQARPEVEQEEIGGAQQPQQAAPAAQPAQTATPAPTGGVPAQGEGSVEQVQHQVNDQAQGVQKVNTAKMKQHYFETMQSVSANIKALDKQSRDKLFGRGGSSGGIVDGYFFVPSYLDNGQRLIEDDEATQIALKVTKPFGVTLDGWDDVPGGYKFKWHNKGEKVQGVTGTSFDDLLSGGAAKGKGGAAGQSPVGKAAFTMGEILRQRKDDLYDTMRKIANGVK